MKVTKRAAIAAAAVAVAGAAIPALASPHSPQGGTTSGVPCNDGTISWTPTNLWPPNHKFVPIHITYYDSADTSNSDGDGDTTSVAVTGVQEQDGDGPSLDATVAETVNGSGKPGQIDAQPDPNEMATPGSDGEDPATFTEDLRAERAGTDGHGSGRTYTLTVQCMDMGGTDAMEKGTASITVTVPHDQGVVKP